jgi:hypothetical protein
MRLPVFCEDYPEFNDYVDEIHDEVKILDGVYRPSEILFMIDVGHVAYRELLVEYYNDRQLIAQLGEQ